ncbi:MAG: ORF6N domain-containing protein [Patescibacteria group bacterium]
MAMILPIEIVENKIFVLRGQKVMLDRDLAKLYKIETKRFNESVQRNLRRFPEDFSFRLTEKEFFNLRSQFATSSWGGIRYPPRAFTESGIAMLSSVLSSEKAIAVNIQIIRAFVYLRDMALEHSDLRLRIDFLEKQYDEQFKIVFDALRQTIDDESKKNKIGFESA